MQQFGESMFYRN